MDARRFSCPHSSRRSGFAGPAEVGVAERAFRDAQSDEGVHLGHVGEPCGSRPASREEGRRRPGPRSRRARRTGRCIRSRTPPRGCGRSRRSSGARRGRRSDAEVGEQQPELVRLDVGDEADRVDTLQPRHPSPDRGLGHPELLGDRRERAASVFGEGVDDAQIEVVESRLPSTGCDSRRWNVPCLRYPWSDDRCAPLFSRYPRHYPYRHPRRLTRKDASRHGQDREGDQDPQR